jgi:lipid-binding SYLF domain-containing protein
MSVALATMLAASVVAPSRAATNAEAQRLDDARVVFQQLRTMPDANIPDALLSQCRCIAIFPGMVKGALGWGARMGRGVMSCRGADGHWSPPVFLTLAGGSFGLQAGVEKADVVLFFMTDKGARSMVESQFTLGGKGSVAAGPVGRTAEAGTDLKLDAEIYSYARSKGLFAGLSLEGARVSVDGDGVARFYGQAVPAQQILFDHKAPTMPPAAESFVRTLP